MGMMNGLLTTLFGAGQNVVAETVQVFRENAENGAARDAARAQAALGQFAAEFAMPRKSIFDQVIDGLNRVPRPAMALGTLGLFVTAMVDPIWFASRMQGIALVPEPLWWLLGAIVGFYFGARHQAKGQEFQRSIATSFARASQVTEGIAALEALNAGQSVEAESTPSPEAEMPRSANGNRHPVSANAALAEWRNARA